MYPWFKPLSPETNPPNTPDPPGTSDSGKSLRVNRTDIIPNQYMYNLNGCVPQMFQFQNMVMELNCSRNMTMNMTSEEGVKIQHLAMNIRTERNMYLEIHAKGCPLRISRNPKQALTVTCHSRPTPLIPLTPPSGTI